MNMMEQIKIKIEDSKVVAVDFSVEEVQHLLSKLQIAEKALEQINEMGYNELVCADHNALINKALQQIRS